MKPKSDTSSLKTTDLQLELDQLKEKYARALADYQNLEKRTAQQQSQVIQLTHAALVSRFLDVLDDLERALSHSQDQGVQLIITRFKKTFEDEGVTELTVLGETYDPITMECLDQVPGEKDKVINVIQKGYLLRERLLRPARVEVGNGHLENK